MIFLDLFEGDDSKKYVAENVYIPKAGDKIKLTTGETGVCLGEDPKMASEGGYYAIKFDGKQYPPGTYDSVYFGKILPGGQVKEGELTENASKLLSAEDRNDVITVVVQAPDGTKKTFSDQNPRAVDRWLMKYNLKLPVSITSKFIYEGEDLAWDDPDLVQARKFMAAKKANEKSGQKVAPAKSKQAPTHKYASKKDVKEGQDSNPVAQAITRRILSQRHDLLAKYGPVLITQAIDEVADFVGDVEEIGSSDVSGWIKQVEQMLANNPPEAFGEDLAEAPSDAIGHTAKSLENPPKVMQHRARRDQERDRNYMKTQIAKNDKTSKDEWGDLKENQGTYQGQFPTKEAAIAYAKESVKRFRDPEDGIEIWAMPNSSFDVVATMNSNGRNDCVAKGGKKLGTVGPRYQGVAEDDAHDVEQRMIAKIEKEKQRLAKLKQTDPEAYQREMVKSKTSGRVPPVSTFEDQGAAEGSDNITAVFSGYGNYMKGRAANVFKHYGITVLGQQYDEDEDIAEYTVSGNKAALDQARAYLERSDQFGGMILKQGVAEGSIGDKIKGAAKSVKRASQGWGAGGESDAVSPKDVVQAFGKMDGQRLANFVASRKDLSKPKKDSARAFADKVIDREMKQRGYGRVADKDEQGVAEDGQHRNTDYRHRVSISYADPNSTAASQRKELQQKIILVPATNKDGTTLYQGEAEELARQWAKRQGWRVKEINYVELVKAKPKQVDEFGINPFKSGKPAPKAPGSSSAEMRNYFAKDTGGNIPNISRDTKSPDQNTQVYRRTADMEEGYRVVPDINKERYVERPGLEGPFHTKSGRVVYYDKQEGKYYDPDSDFYISHDDYQAMNEAGYVNKDSAQRDYDFGRKGFGRGSRDRDSGEAENQGVFKVEIDGRPWKSGGDNEMHQLAANTKRKYPNKEIVIVWPTGQRNVVKEDTDSMPAVDRFGVPHGSKYYTPTKQKVNELSTDKLAQYKTAAAADAKRADQAGDFKRGDKRFSGMNKATMKQFSNDAKK
jgi:hypothetical protein